MENKVEAPEYVAKLELIKQMLSPDFDWEKSNDSLRGTWKDCFVLIDLENTKESDLPQVYACGSFTLSDTPKALYRAMYLFGPKRVDFSDMYKQELMAFATPDKRFVATFELFKYEAGVYCYAPKDVIEGKGRGIIAGWPGADNGWHCTDPVGALFFEVVKGLLDYTHMVYGGNDFEV